ncbi:3-keto-5-aminohexanoate cleavage protein [Bradyrhizobium manausense]|uniref:3-keto-5-aminohexanoate cleavage protein n=1 Tax=Bradyrhizobium TaxID=374 RepID=UPI001BA54512|nr:MULTISPECIES: 3-keto-5-aminohexanoate cleavage protein [Bradyrhizobium]MBR0829253.1 3-keto-5-aminohexanoate cleavage protein [Bradyrhizobium manausense]UVO29820.1 3-keto-5-aminohexanoate cleavage protein [Bradyrhizobium arachidis]
MRKVWIEAALNGPWSRAYQPGIPDTIEAIVAEGIACARAGAAIIHTHAYDGGGPQTFDWQVYARIIEGIRATIDVPVYPSIPGLDARGNVADPTARFAHIEALAERGLLEFAVVDPGSVNFTLTTTTAQAKPAETYLNPESHIRHGLSVAVRHGIHPAFAIYEPGFIRAGATLARASGVKTPIYRFMFSQQFAFCFPPKPYGLAALVTLVEEEARGAPWMISGLGVDITPLVVDTVARGGHIRVGLEDALLGSTATNLRLVEDAVRLVRAEGAEPATAEDVRRALGGA